MNKNNQFLPNIIAIWDNQGQTIDRYTAITKNGDVVGFNENPFHPLGFGQFSHNVCDKWADYWERTKDKPYPKLLQKRDVIMFVRDSAHLGKRIRRNKWESLSKEVIQYLTQVSE